jgi:hypothetical protein
MDESDIAELKKRATDAQEAFENCLKVSEVYGEEQKRLHQTRYLDLKRQRDETSAALVAAQAKQPK